MVEANHQIANSLSIIASLIHFQVEGLPADGTVPATDVRNWLQELEAKVETIGDLHGLLISSQKSEAIDLGAYLHRVVDAAKRSFTIGRRTVISFDFKPTCAILVKHAAAIGIFVSEAITNALKYSRPCVSRRAKRRRRPRYHFAGIMHQATPRSDSNTGSGQRPCRRQDCAGTDLCGRK